MESIDYEKLDAAVEQEYQAFIKKLELEKRVSKSELQEIKRAYQFAKEAHKHQRRKSGELYISHPLRVAKIVYDEMGLFSVSIICAFLHDVVEDTPVEHSDIEQQFGKKVRNIVEGLTKISKTEMVAENNSMQAENYRRILLTISDDVRVILVKIADRLHNMRTLKAMKETSQLKIAAETLYLYASVAHRLGLYSIKSELEDLALSHIAPLQYDEIKQKLNTTEDEAKAYIQHFIKEVTRLLAPTKLQFVIKSRFKSVYSIYNKIQTKHVRFEEIMDLYAIRIILEDREGSEIEDCWRVYTYITEKFPQNPSRTRDWLRFPKANGYQSLHTTVTGPEGNAVEIQIRTQKMDEIAEKGNGAHWMYKNGEEDVENPIDPNIVKFIEQVRLVLENPNLNAIEAVHELTAGLKPEALSVFTPKGAMKFMPANACVLDFAYDIHSKIGDYAIGAKINGVLAPLHTILQQGDKVEVITSQKKSVSEEWLGWVKSIKARNIIKESLKVQRKELIPKGREIFNIGSKWLKITEDHPDMPEFLKYVNLATKDDLFYEMGKYKEFGKSNVNVTEKLREFLRLKEENKPILQKVVPKKEDATPIDMDLLVLGKQINIEKMVIASCCNPVPGDDIVALQRKNYITVHRSDCPKAIYSMANFGGQIVKANFADGLNVSFLTALKVEGDDSKGILMAILGIITVEMNLNMRKVTIDTKDGKFEGLFLVYIQNAEQLQKLMHDLKDKVAGVKAVSRTNSHFEPFERLE